MAYRNGGGSRNGNGATRTEAPPEKKKEPVASFEFPVQGGRLNIAVWESTYGEGDKEKVSNNVTFKRSYFDTKDKEWKDTTYLRQGDLPAMALALQHVYFQIVQNNEQP